jgi:hypothetical protein
LLKINTIHYLKSKLTFICYFFSLCKSKNRVCKFFVLHNENALAAVAFGGFRSEGSVAAETKQAAKCH